MKLFEYRGKELFDKYGIAVPNGKLVASEKDFSNLNFPLVLKAQVPIGGRGKAGGIKTVDNLKDAKEKTQASKATFKETIKGASEKKETTKAKVKQKTSAKKTLVKKSPTKKKVNKKSPTKKKSRKK